MLPVSHRAGPATLRAHEVAGPGAGPELISASDFSPAEEDLRGEAEVLLEGTIEGADVTHVAR
jgi:hypothetical protein